MNQSLIFLIIFFCKTIYCASKTDSEAAAAEAGFKKKLNPEETEWHKNQLLKFASKKNTDGALAYLRELVSSNVKYHSIQFLSHPDKYKTTEYVDFFDTLFKRVENELKEIAMQASVVHTHHSVSPKTYCSAHKAPPAHTAPVKPKISTGLKDVNGKILKSDFLKYLAKRYIPDRTPTKLSEEPTPEDLTLSNEEIKIIKDFAFAINKRDLYFGDSDSKDTVDLENIINLEAYLLCYKVNGNFDKNLTYVWLLASLWSLNKKEHISKYMQPLD